MSVDMEKKIIKTHSSIEASSTKAFADNDIIVPDYQSDVKKVLTSHAIPIIREKHIQSSYITLSGKICYSVVYLSDENDGSSNVKSIHTEVPFTHQIEAQGVADADFVKVMATVDKVECSAVNSRKINLKSQLDFDTNIICNEEFEAVASAQAEFDLPCKSTDVSSFSLSSYAENEFEVSSSFSIPSGSDMIDELLSVDVKISGAEIKSINTKLVAKGSVDICALYTDTTGDLKSIRGEIPFTELLSVEGVGASDLWEVEYSLTDLQYAKSADSDGDISNIDISVCINASTCVYMQSLESIAEDLYSPDCQLSLACDTMKVQSMVCSGNEKINVSEIVEIGNDEPNISSLYNVTVTPFIESAEVNGDTATVSGKSEVVLHYLTSEYDLPVHSIKKDIPFSYTVPADNAENPQISAVCTVENLGFNAMSLNSADVKFTLDFDTKIIAEAQIPYIKDVEISSDCSDCSDMPSIVIYFASKGESLWDIAKKYHTTTAQICIANNTNFPEILTENKKIMIPKRKTA